jgi:hypothetical protein
MARPIVFWNKPKLGIAFEEKKVYSGVEIITCDGKSKFGR